MPVFGVVLVLSNLQVLVVSAWHWLAVNDSMGEFIQYRW
eukprot:SAG31_NODE_48551_length_182_cov_14.036145_1_plen_38_part_10